MTALAVAPTFHTAPDYSVTLGDEVADLGRSIGFAPYPEQELILNDTFALDKRGRSAVFEQGVIAPRQQMKTGLLKLTALGWLYVTDQRLILWSAHEFDTTQEAFRDLTELIGGNDFLSRRVKRIQTAHGDECIELHGDRRLMFKARTGKGGRGFTGSKIILDEAFALQPSHMGALLPTLIRVADPQVIYGSSAGMASSAILRGVRDRGRRGNPRTAYTEYAAPYRDCATEVCQHEVGTPGCALDDIELWRLSCVVTARDDFERMEIIADLRSALTPEEFMREILGWWDDPQGEAPIDADLWATLLDPSSRIPSRRVLVLDVSPMRNWSCLVAAGMRPDGKVHLEVTGTPEAVDYRPGVGWVLGRMDELKSKFGRRVSLMSGSAAAGLMPALRDRGWDVDVIPSEEIAAACGQLYDLAVNDGLRHLGQSPLDTAVPATRRRDISDKTFVWARKGAADITPTYAATLACWRAWAASGGFNIW